MEANENFYGSSHVSLHDDVNDDDDDDSDVSLDIYDKDSICLSDLESTEDAELDNGTHDLEATAELPKEDQNLSDKVPETTKDKTIKKFINFIEYKVESLVQYNDINDLIADRRSFLVDGESLLACSIYKSCLDQIDGGQMLHCIYICERMLQIFARIGISFEIVFFDIWEKLWRDRHSILLTRSALKKHFKYNAGLTVHEVNTVWSKEFKHILDDSRPSFLWCNFSVEGSLSVFTEENQRNFKALTYANIFYSFSQGLPCVDFHEITQEVSTINAFIIECDPVSDRTLFNTSRMLNDTIVMDETVNMLVDIPLGIKNVRQTLYIGSAAKYLAQNKGVDAEFLVRILLFKCALLEILPLKFRAFVCTKVELPKEASYFITEIHKIMHTIMKQQTLSDYCYRSVPDIWQGSLFSILILLLRTLIIREKHELGTSLQKIYFHLISIVNDVSGKTLLKPFPVTSEKLQWPPRIELGESQNLKTNIKTSAVPEVSQLLATSCPLTQEFCGEIVLNNLNTMECHKLESIVLRNKDFEEKYHWHSRRKLNDEIGRIPDNNELMKEKYAHSRYAKEKILKNQMLFAKYMNIYGRNLEGKFIQAETVVRSLKKNHKAQSTDKSKICHNKKLRKSSKADLIRMENAKRLQHQNEDFDKQTFKKHFQNINGSITSFRYDTALQEVKLLQQILKTEVFKCETLLLKAKILHKCILIVFQEEGNKSTMFIERCKEFFLLLRQILIESETLYDLSDEQKKEIGYYLTCLNMHDISIEWNLDYVYNPDQITTIDTRLTWAEFQLKHLGPHLLRENPAEIDAELGFAPDDWQKTLINCIRKRQSAVVVAPTSSGKTYASYYCMKSVLQEGTEGIIVYVCPTKALVNQVAATVYARFKNVKMPPGQSVYGIFTRDYREYAMNCQILVTVPECLEILLLSPAVCIWVNRLRYMIFDEIHCLSGIAGGLSWELGLLLSNCPFLALSATVEHPEALHNWLQESMNFKKKRDIKNGCKKEDLQYKVTLIIHNERHNDLKKHVYIHEGNLTHVHPYACLTNKIVEMYNGIPSHVSLSPEEALLLFDALQATEQTHTKIGHLRPEEYFRRNSRKFFVTRSSTKQYERDLRELLSKWHQDFNDSFTSVINHLKNDVEHLEHNLRRVDLVKQLPALVEMLQRNQMFPALIFLFDRCLIHIFLDRLNQHYGNNFVDTQAVSAKNHREKRTETKKSSIHSFLNKVNQQVSCVGAQDVAAGSYREKRTTQENSNISLGLLEGDSPSVRNLGTVDNDDLKFIENRLIRKGCTKNDEFVTGLRNGLGIHHSGLDMARRMTVEMLFRMKVLNVVFATSTLALGIHMPCKTVVVASDSRYLTPLNYHQMSGRAGRRGFDVEGNVVFWGIKESKIQNLLTGKLPVMLGNFPMSVTLVLRLLLLVSNCRNVSSTKTDVKSVEENTLSRVLTFLNCCLMYQNTPELKQQMKHFFAFSTQLLMIQKLLDDDGNPQHFCSGIVTHLHYHEPGNLVFSYLLRRGILHEICVIDEDGKVSKETQFAVVLLMSHLFTHLPLHNSVAKNSVVKLPQLSEKIVEVIEQYNEEVKFVFDHYFRCVGEDCARSMGEDNILPVSKICIKPDSFHVEKCDGNDHPFVLQEILANSKPPLICSAFAALSGYTDEGLYSETDIVSNLRHQVFTDNKKIVPLFDTDKIRNAYAWDFYNHGIRKAIIKDNGLRAGDDFKYLKDFLLVLLSVSSAMQNCDDDPKNNAVLQTFKIVAKNFQEKFHKEYNKI